MSLADAAAALGLPEDLVQRSAAARAAETGASVDEILAAWAGGGTVAASSSAGQESADTGATPEPAETAPEPDIAEESEPASTPQIEPADQPTVSPSGRPKLAPVPSQVTAAEAAHLPEVVTVPTAGIRERTNFSIPRWLVALMLIAPLFALFALGGAATGVCGEGTELDTNVITGEIVNCDGSEFTGAGIGGGGTDYIALGQTIFEGNAVAGVNCSGCHGIGGAGTAAGPSLSGVLTTFGACTDHLEWVTLGTQGFQNAGRNAYGDTNKPVGGFGMMPGFGSSLSAEQIAAAASYERVRFGGANPDETLVECGLVEADGGDGETAPGEDGGAPTEGDGTTDTTVGDTTSDSASG